jgi:hypothetical protein
VTSGSVSRSVVREVGGGESERGGSAAGDSELEMEGVGVYSWSWKDDGSGLRVKRPKTMVIRVLGKFGDLSGVVNL